MSKLSSTSINGNLSVVGSDILVNSLPIMTNSKIKNTIGEIYYLPIVIWHGRLNLQTSTVVTVYQSSGLSLSLSYESTTGIYRAYMSGNSTPISDSDYQVWATGVGVDGAGYVTIPDNWKTAISFRILYSDDASLNNGYCEITIVKFIKINK